MQNSKKFVEVLCKNIVANPDAIVIKEISGETTCVYEIQANPGDIGMIIGKQGRTIDAIRTLVEAASSAVKDKRKHIIEVLEDRKREEKNNDSQKKTNTPA